MALPKWLNEAIESDVQALVWSKQIEFDAEEEGTEASFKRYMKKGAQFSPNPQKGSAWDC